MGFGHRVYKTWDPRAVILKRFSKQLAEESGDPHWYDMSEQIEHTVVLARRASTRTSTSTRRRPTTTSASTPGSSRRSSR